LTGFDDLGKTVIKQRMQVHGSVHKTMAQCARAIYRAEGFHAFYVSYPTTLCMTVPFTATQFVAYESMSKVMNPTHGYDPFTHCIAGGLAGAFAAGITTPLDVIKTLLQTRGLAEDKEIRTAGGLFNAAAIIKRQFGWQGFLRGMRPRIISTMPSTAICWYVKISSGPRRTTSLLTGFLGHPTKWRRRISSATVVKVDILSHFRLHLLC
jgi:solute carrier family 25 (mitochondrial iron transporter), member 28/37